MRSEKNNKTILKVSKRYLLLIASLVWGYAAYKVLKIGYYQVAKSPRDYWIHILIGISGAYIFFIGVFWKVFCKHLKRILGLSGSKYYIFSFFNLKSYIIMISMILLGITIKRVQIIPLLYLGVFYISLGGALLTASLSFMSSFIDFKGEKV